MRYRRWPWLTALSVLTAASISLPGVPAASAQSNTGEYWIRGQSLSELGGKETVTGKVGATGGNFLIPGIGLSIKCTTAKVVEATIDTKGPMSNEAGKGELEKARGKIEFKNCSIEGAEEACTVVTPIVVSGIRLIYVFAELIILTLQPLLSSPFTLLTISGGECPFEASQEMIAGDMVYAGVNEPGVEQVKQSFVPATEAQEKSLAKMIEEEIKQREAEKLPAPAPLAPLKYGGETATLDGEAIEELSGANTGFSWGIK